MYAITMALTFSCPQTTTQLHPNNTEFYQTGTLLDYLNHTVPAQFTEAERSAPLLLVKTDHQKLLIIQQTHESTFHNFLTQLLHYVFAIPVKHLVSLILFPFHFFW
tara:strand:+ start:216 stop:533 length:318 start_codon:yes stop_codon:yes gene_type:complete